MEYSLIFHRTKHSFRMQRREHALSIFKDTHCGVQSIIDVVTPLFIVFVVLALLLCVCVCVCVCMLEATNDCMHGKRRNFTLRRFPLDIDTKVHKSDGMPKELEIIAIEPCMYMFA